MPWQQKLLLVLVLVLVLVAVLPVLALRLPLLVWLPLPSSLALLPHWWLLLPYLSQITVTITPVRPRQPDNIQQGCSV
jgi:hypothetical protein